MNNKKELMVSIGLEVLAGWAAKLADGVDNGGEISSQINALILQSAVEELDPRAMGFEAYLYKYYPAKSAGKDSFDRYLDADVQLMYDLWQHVHRHRSTPRPVYNTLTFGYTNWRGEYGIRNAVPEYIFFGSTEWHPEPQWLLRALDTEKNASRDFALKDMGFV